MPINWKKQKQEEIMAKAHDAPYVESLPDSEREALQLDLCRRFNWTYTRPDGTVPAVPVTGPGDEV